MKNQKIMHNNLWCGSGENFDQRFTIIIIIYFECWRGEVRKIVHMRINR